MKGKLNKNILCINWKSYTALHTMGQNWLFRKKNLISATEGIGRVYKLQEWFIILLGVYC